MKKKDLLDSYSKLFIKYREEDCTASFTKLYVDSSLKMRPFFNRNIQNTEASNDIFHDSWSKLLKKPELFKEESGDFFSYFRTIVINNSKKYKTKKTALSFIDFDEEIHYLGKNNSQKDLLSLISLNELTCLVDKMTEKHKELILLHYYYDVTLNEIGRILGVNANTLKSRLVRAREVLKSMLKAKGIFINL